MSTIQLEKSNAEEVTHLFTVMKKYKVGCTLELNNKIALQPYITVYDGTFHDFDLSNESDIQISFGEAEMRFEAKRFSANVTDSRIYVLIVSSDFRAWFRSSKLPPEAIEEANNTNTPTR